MSKRSLLQELVKRCTACDFIDKPFLKYKVYDRWLPDITKLLIVVESPPPGRKETFFYNLDRWDRLRSNLSKILGIGNGGIELLIWLKERGAFLTDAIKCRPPSKAQIPRMYRLCSRILAKEIETLHPQALLLMGTTAKRTLRLALDEIDWLPTTIMELPHPNHVIRFRRDLIPKIRETLIHLLKP